MCPSQPSPPPLTSIAQAAISALGVLLHSCFKVFFHLFIYCTTIGKLYLELGLNENFKLIIFSSFRLWKPIEI
jgi:hypothetical protein